jgi:hypothetical protein
VTTRRGVACVRCGGTMIAQYDEVYCLACGYNPPTPNDLRLAIEAERDYGRKRGPRIGGLKLT